MGLGNRIFVFVAFTACISEAFVEVGKVDVVIASRQIANLTIESAIDESAKSLFLGSKDRNCEGKILKRDQNIITVDISGCNDVELKTGSSVYYMADVSRGIDPAKPEVADENGGPDKVHKFGIGFRVNNRLSFTQAKIMSGTSIDTGTIEYTSSGVPLVVEWNFSWTTKNAWGWGAGATYTSMNWDKVTLSGTTGKTTLSAMGTTAILSPFANAIYRWDNTFVSMGFNLSSLSHDGSTPLFISQNKGTLGAQLGFGVIVNKNFSFLIESKAFGFGGSSVTSGTTTLDADLGFVSGVNFMGLFSF